MVLKDHPPLAIAPQKTAARAAQRTVRELRERRNGTRVRRMRLVEDSEAETMPPLTSEYYIMYIGAVSTRSGHTIQGRSSE